jgi:MFS family permease
MVGLMQVFGNVLGFALAAIATAQGNVGVAVGAIAVVELVTMLSVVLRVPKGPPAKPREGRSWVQIAAETWGTDILKEHSYVWLLISRLFILMGGASLVNFVIFYLGRSLSIAETDIDTAVLQLLAAATLAALVSIIPASRLSDRIGRKPVIWGCTAFGMLGLVLVALAPNLMLATIGAALLGSSQGTFLSVDWALMTDIIPKAASGRYMGLSNVVTASSTTIAVAIGGLTMDAVGDAVGIGAGPRTVMLLGIIYFTLGALALRRVDEPRRGRAAEATPMPPAPGTP